jgi:hypothetical protein
MYHHPIGHETHSHKANNEGNNKACDSFLYFISQLKDGKLDPDYAYNKLYEVITKSNNPLSDDNLLLTLQVCLANSALIGGEKNLQQLKIKMKEAIVTAKKHGFFDSSKNTQRVLRRLSDDSTITDIIRCPIN